MKAGVTHRADGSTNFHGHKNGGGSWFNVAHNTTSGKGQNPVTSSKSPARKAASALIAKIPLALSSHIARVYRPTSFTSSLVISEKP